jgi:endonuclease/exonuclease/phosphatase family metal-dependent hydrolase
MKAVKIILQYLLFTIIVVVVLIASFLIYFTVIDYKPVPFETLKVSDRPVSTTLDKDEFTFVTWNIGYCGLDKNMDFFYDGGKKVRPTDSSFQKNLNGVYNFLAENDSADFIFLQEVDTLAKRSYFTNEVSLFSNALSNYKKSFATNYNVKYVPMPLLNPMGEVVSGIVSFSKASPDISERYSFPVNYSWPLKLFMLDRCFIMQRYKLKDGHELVLINTHNSAFDNADVLRQYELWMLRGFLLAEYAEGNYVVVGGDWNENPPGYNNVKYFSCFRKKAGLPMIPENYLPENWHWAYDPKMPTNRDVDAAYRPGYTQTTTIDYFVTSPNVIVEDVKAIPTGFEFSDHQPVYMRIRLDNDPLHTCSEDCRDIISDLQDSLKMFNEKKPVVWKPKKGNPKK